MTYIHTRHKGSFFFFFFNIDEMEPNERIRRMKERKKR
jgi:hypothetical protein